MSYAPGAWGHARRARGTAQAGRVGPWGRRDATRRVQAGIYLIVGILEALLLIRFVLPVLGASPDAGFADGGAAATGICAANNDPCGCKQKIEDGKATAAICVD